GRLRGAPTPVFYSTRRRRTPDARALLRFDEEVSAAVLGPAGFVVIGADRPLLTVGDDAHPVLRHTLADEIIHRRLGPALAERQVVLVGASLVAVALDEHQHRAVALQPRRVGVEHLRIDRKSTRLNSSHDQISYAG